MTMSAIDMPHTARMAATLSDSGRAKGGYICYAIDGCPTNAAYSAPGHGESPQEAALAATYWANQAPWVRVVPWSRAPLWARCACLREEMAHD